MVVVTRSKKSSSSTTKKSKTVIPYEDQESVSNDSSSFVPSSNEEEDDDDYEEDEFLVEIPSELNKNPKLKATYDKILHHIKTKRTPQLCDILKSKIQFKKKVDLFEIYVLYQNAEPFSEEQLQYRDVLKKLLPIYKKEYKKFLENKNEIKELETRLKNLDDVSTWSSKIIKLNTSDSNKNIILRKYNEFQSLMPDDSEYGKLEAWMRYALALPYWNVSQSIISTNITEYLENVKRKLDERLYGMNDVKEQILLFLHVKLLNPSLQGCSIGLIGPPGSGKTSIARSLSDILGWKCEQISFGGVNNSDFLKGNNFAYVGGRPGEIVNCLMRMKCSNGILFFDEFDKVSENPDVVASLLHITDFSQNSCFRDHYLCELEIDLSRLWFIYSMNELPKNSALRDRIFPIYVEGYSVKEKVRIIVDYLFPLHLKDVSLSEVSVSDEVAQHIIYKSQMDENDKGVRTIEKAVKDIVKKLSFIINHKKNNVFKDFSFYRGETITLPYELTSQMVDVCLSTFKNHIKQTNNMMYL